MDEPLPGKPPRASRVTLAQLMQPTDANIQGIIHGGWIMKLIDEAGALACIRHAGRRVMTVAVDRLVFQQPIRPGNVARLTAEVIYVGRTSMEAEVRVVAENPLTGECTETNTAYMIYVAPGPDGRPAPVPPLLPETEVERQRFEEGKQRQAYRLEQKRRSES